jgi:hybrid polyketide synthase/nonribosomal peptide synthetase ACE1
VGHTEGTAGLAGLLKASLALQSAMIPPNMLFDQLNPKIEPFYTNLKIPTTAQPWPALPPGVPRRASVNSFGYGGTNAHAILEAYEGITTPSASNDNRLAFTPFTFSATSEKTLRQLLAAYAAYLQESPSVNVRDLSWTLHSRKSRLPFTTIISGTTQERLLTNIRTKLEESAPKQFATGQRKPSHPESARLLGVFTGQGAQWATMGRELWQSAKVREIIQTLDDSLQNLSAENRPEWTLASEFMADASSSRLGTAEIAQPMCTAVQIVLVQLLRAAEVTFTAVVGHSSGEIAAAYAASFISAEDAIRVAYYRGVCSRLAQGPNGEEGSMMAVSMSFSDAVEFCEAPEFQGRIAVAAVNSSASITLSGDTDAIELAKEILDKKGKPTRLLVVDKAYHSHHMRPSSDRYINLLRKSRIILRQPPVSACAWYSSVTGEKMAWADAGILTDTYWNDNMINPVLYSQAVESAVADLGPFSLAIEVGPHPALRGPTLQVIQDPDLPSLPYTPTLRRGSNDVEAMASCLGYLWETLPSSILNLSKYDAFLSGGPDPQLVKDLPTYPWDHDHVHWFESRVWKAIRTKTRPFHPLLGSFRADGVEEEFHWRNFLSPRELPWLSDHRIQGQMVLPAGAYIATAIEAAKAICAEDSIRLIEVLDLVMLQAVIFSDESSSVETLVSVSNITHEQKHIALTDFSFFSAAGKESTMLTRNAYARLKITYAAPTADALPVEQPPFGDMVEVPSERFYTSLEPLGYGYTGPFRALAGMKRRLGVTTGSVIRHPSPDLAQLTLHPATLDGAIQTILLAKSFPGDGELWCLLVPKVVRRVVVNPTYCDSYDLTAPVAFPVDSILTDTHGSDAQGDIDIYSPDGQYTIARIEGMQVVPLEAANPANDRLLFSSVVFRPSLPDLDVLTLDGKATAENYEFAKVMERVAVFYLKQIHLSFADDDRARHEGPYVGLLRFAAHVSDLVASGGHRYAPQGWSQDTQSVVLRESQRLVSIFGFHESMFKLRPLLAILKLSTSLSCT